MIFNPIARLVAGGSLIVVLGIGAALYAGKLAAESDAKTARGDLKTAADQADLACGRAHSSFRVYDRRTGKPLPVGEWGKDCDKAVLTLQTRVDGEQGRLNEALLQLQAENDAKYEADLAAARRNASRRSESLKSLEAADAAITNGHYPDRWWMALGDTLGLRQAAETPAPAEPGPAGGSGEGAPAR